jgi:general stress protein YciG
VFFRYSNPLGNLQENEMANQDGQSGQGHTGETGSSGRGFAGMDENKQRDIAAQGGRSVPDDKRSFSQDSELASEAGQKGGEASAGRSEGEGREAQGGRPEQSRDTGQTRQDDGRFGGSDDVERGDRR